MRIPVVLFVALIWLMGLIAGASLTHSYDITHQPPCLVFRGSSSVAWPIPQSPVLHQMTPMLIRVHVLSVSDFVKFGRKDDKGFNPTTAAWSDWSNPVGKSCDVYVPEGWWIVGDRQSGMVGSGFFLEDSPNSILPHEFLHCYLGAWHSAQRK